MAWGLPRGRGPTEITAYWAAHLRVGRPCGARPSGVFAERARYRCLEALDVCPIDSGRSFWEVCITRSRAASAALGPISQRIRGHHEGVAGGTEFVTTDAALPSIWAAPACEAGLLARLAMLVRIYYSTVVQSFPDHLCVRASHDGSSSLRCVSRSAESGGRQMAWVLGRSNSSKVNRERDSASC
jgi:hypothetical protein